MFSIEISENGLIHHNSTYVRSLLSKTIKLKNY